MTNEGKKQSKINHTPAARKFCLENKKIVIVKN